MLLELFERARHRWTLRRRIAEELRFHLAEAADAYAADGMTARSAREYAKLRLGDPRAITRDCLALATEQEDPALKPWRIPVRAYAAAMLVPPILALVLVPHHVAPLPQAESGLAVSSKRVPGAFELAEDPTQGVAAFRHTSATLHLPGGLPAAYAGQLVSGNFFELQQVRPQLGTGFGSFENEIVLSHRLWRDRFGADAGVAGRAVQVNGRMYRIVAVMPEAFWFVNRSNQFWIRSRNVERKDLSANLLLLREPGELPTGQLEIAEHTVSLLPLEDISRTHLRGATGIAGAALWLLAALGLVQTTSLLRVLGRQRAPIATLARNFLFLFVKAVPPLATAGVLWLAFRESDMQAGTSYFGGVWSFLSTFLFALFCVAVVWQSLIDQRLRCLCCLRRLSMPLPHGVIGSILFALPGTEYICAYGHGTLYVPAPTSEGLREPRWHPPAGAWAELLGSSATPQG